MGFCYLAFSPTKFRGALSNIFIEEVALWGIQTAKKGIKTYGTTYYYFKFIDRAFPEIRNRVKKFDDIVPAADYEQE